MFSMTLSGYKHTQYIVFKLGVKLEHLAPLSWSHGSKSILNFSLMLSYQWLQSSLSRDFRMILTP